MSGEYNTAALSAVEFVPASDGPQEIVVKRARRSETQVIVMMDEVRCWQSADGEDFEAFRARVFGQTGENSFVIFGDSSK